MKLKTTKKAIKASGQKILCIGYCNAQYLLKGKNPFAYSVRAEGWACDYYEINDVIVSTGYAPMGDKIDYEILKKYEIKAEKIANDYNLGYEEREEKINSLLNKFIEEIKY